MSKVMKKWIDTSWPHGLTAKDIPYDNKHSIQDVLDKVLRMGYKGKEAIDYDRMFVDDSGNVGITGYTGLQGYTGCEGYTGLQGYTGFSGILGATGVQGPIRDDSSSKRYDWDEPGRSSHVSAARGLERKADKCLSLAYSMYPTMSNIEIEGMATEFMSLPEENIDKMYHSLEQSQVIKNLNGEPVIKRPFSVNEVSKEIKTYDLELEGFDKEETQEKESVPLFQRKSFGKFKDTIGKWAR